jgi:hypothetical protein
VLCCVVLCCVVLCCVVLCCVVLCVHLTSVHRCSSSKMSKGSTASTFPTGSSIQLGRCSFFLGSHLCTLNQSQSLFCCAPPFVNSRNRVLIGVLLRNYLRDLKEESE